MPEFSQIIHSWDTAFKKGAENSYSVGTVWGLAKNGYYLISVWRGRVEFPELKRVLISLSDQWKPTAVLIEDRASGQSLIQELQSASRLPVLPIRIDSDKLSRAQAVTPLIEAGKVFLPESAPWLADYMEELAAFPTGAHDDAVDSTTQALNYFRDHSSVPLLWSVGKPNQSLVLDKEAIWDKAMRGFPLTEAEFDRL